MTYNALRTIVLLGGIFFLKILFNKYHLDKFRDELFSIRRDLFLIAAGAEHKITFKSKIYIDMNRLFNNMIRFAHNVSFLQAILFSFFNKISFNKNTIVKSSLIANVEMEIQRINNPAKKKALCDLLERYNRAITIYLVHTSCVFLFIAIVRFIPEFFKELFCVIERKQKELLHSFVAPSEHVMSWRLSRQAEYAVA